MDGGEPGAVDWESRLDPSNQREKFWTEVCGLAIVDL